jgi:hypothetical protein
MVSEAEKKRDQQGSEAYRPEHVVPDNLADEYAERTQKRLHSLIPPISLHMPLTVRLAITAASKTHNPKL